MVTELFSWLVKVLKGIDVPLDSYNMYGKLEHTRLYILRNLETLLA